MKIPDHNKKSKIWIFATKNNSEEHGGMKKMNQTRTLQLKWKLKYTTEEHWLKLSEVLQDSNWEIKTLYDQLFRSLGRRWRNLWHSQGYRMQV